MRRVPRLPPRLTRSVRSRRIALQVLVIGTVAALAAFLGGNLLANLSRRRAGAGYGYLQRPAGFAIADSGFDSADPIWEAMAVGIKNTTIVALTGIGFALALGFLIGIARLSRNWLVNRAASLYVETLRNVPVLVVIVFMYFALILQLPPIRRASEPFGIFVFSNSGAIVPSFRRVDGILPLIGMAIIACVAAALVAIVRTRRSERTGLPHHRVILAGVTFLVIVITGFLISGMPVRVSIPERVENVVTGGIRMPAEFAALLAGLVVYTASHIAEIVRGSILAIPRGQSEAATALGLSEFARLRFVVVPQAIRIMIPPLANQFLNLTKNSSLAVFIGYPEITRITNIIISQGNPAPQPISLLMLSYLTISLTIAAVTNVVNRRMQVVTR